MKAVFTGFVLAGGKSSRMERDKFSLEIGGETFLDRAVNTLRTVCENVKIVLNQTQNIETDLPVVRDIYRERGALGGIHAALRGCETKFAVVLAVDLPLVAGEALENLTRLALASNEHAAVVPRQADGRAQPLCGVYRVGSCLDRLENLLSERENASVRDLLALIEPQYIAAHRLSGDEKLLFNVNYPEDYQTIS